MPTLTDKPKNPVIRYSATLHPKGNHGLDRVVYMNLERLPSQLGEITVLVTREVAVKLTEGGIVMKIIREYPVKPLDPKLVIDDASAMTTLRRRIDNIKKKGVK